MLRLRLIAAGALFVASSATADMPADTTQYLVSIAPASTGTTNTSSSPERAAAINGSQYAIVFPIFTGTGGNTSYLRLGNGDQSSSTFEITVVGSPSGRVYGTTSKIVPANSSPQFVISEILTPAAVTGFTGGDTAYALYIQNSSQSAYYQHVIFNPNNRFFEDTTLCAPGTSLQGDRTLSNIHTTTNASYPATVLIHNTLPVNATYQVDVRDSQSGTLLGTVASLNANANSSYAIPFSFFQEQVSFTPSASQFHGNLTFSATADFANLLGVSPSTSDFGGVFGYFVLNQEFNSQLNLSNKCRINKVQTTTAATTSFSGVVGGSSSQSGTISVTVQANLGAGAAEASGTPNDIERSQAVSAASGTLALTGTSAVSLAGTYNPATATVSISGGGFSFTGILAGSVLDGSYTGANGTSGGFSALNTASAVTSYCGTFSSPEGTGIFNMTISANGAVTGVALGFPPHARLAGRATGSSVTGTTSTGLPHEAGVFSATIQGNAISGTARVLSNNETSPFTGQVCTI